MEGRAGGILSSLAGSLFSNTLPKPPYQDLIKLGRSYLFLTFSQTLPLAYSERHKLVAPLQLALPVNKSERVEAIRIGEYLAFTESIVVETLKMTT